MLAQLRATTTASAVSDGVRVPAIAAGVGATLASGFVLRGAARMAREVLPAPVANAAPGGDSSPAAPAPPADDSRKAIAARPATERSIKETLP